jgi:hypothetical protein
LCNAFLISHMRAIRPAHLILLDLITLIIFGRVQIVKLHIMEFSPTSRHFNHLRSKYSPKHPVLRNPQPVSLP